MDGWVEKRVAFTPDKRTHIRRELGIASGERFVLFVSQPIGEVYGRDRTAPRYLGFDEWKVFELLEAALGALVRRSASRIFLGVRLHPRESPAGWSNRTEGGLRREVLQTHETASLALAADLVVGMNSMFLVEACALGCKTLSLQPDLLGADSLPTNRLGLSRAVYRSQDVAAVLDEALNDPSSKSEAVMPWPPGATERVKKLIYELASRKVHL
jgi:hypothetical protein